VLAKERSNQVSSFTVIKGSLIDETFTAFSHWDLSRAKRDNLLRLVKENWVGGSSANWLRDVAFVLSRRFQPVNQDRPLVELAQAGCDPAIWRPLLLWHMTRDEFLLRDFLVHWLFEQYADGAFQIHTEEVIPYLRTLPEKAITAKSAWSEQTVSRVASGLLRMAVDFGLMVGSNPRRFSSYHMPDESFLYLLHAMAESQPNARNIIQSEDWRMYLMTPDDVEREMLRLHQYQKLHYEVAGSLAQLKLPCDTASDYAGVIVS
jgi:hypothetical protein